jgi:hypothetical protein
MAITRNADQVEATTLRRAFARQIAEVCFWDREHGGGFAAVAAFDAQGRPVGLIELDGDHPHVEALAAIPENRGETVKFWLLLD